MDISKADFFGEGELGFDHSCGYVDIINYSDKMKSWIYSKECTMFIAECNNAGVSKTGGDFYHISSDHFYVHPVVFMKARLMTMSVEDVIRASQGSRKPFFCDKVIEQPVIQKQIIEKPVTPSNGTVYVSIFHQLIGYNDKSVVIDIRETKAAMKFQYQYKIRESINDAINIIKNNCGNNNLVVTHAKEYSRITIKYTFPDNRNSTIGGALGNIVYEHINE